MKFSTWLKLEIQQSGWAAGRLDQVMLEAVLLEEREPDFEFCYQAALVLKKSPYRVLHLAGLLSDFAYKFSLRIDDPTYQPSFKEVYKEIGLLSVKEREHIAMCLDQNEHFLEK